MNPVFYVPANLDTAAINAQVALAAGTGDAGVVLLPPGVYATNTGKVFGANGVHIKGSGAGTVIKVPDGFAFDDYLIDGRGFNDFRLSDLTLSMGGVDPDDTLPDGSGAVCFGAVSGVGGVDCGIHRVKVLKMGRYGIWAKGGTRRLDVSHNVVQRDVPAGTVNIGIGFRMDGGTANFFARVMHNYVEGTCTDVPCFEGTIGWNILRHSAFGCCLGADDGPYNIRNLFHDNLCEGGIGRDILGTDVQGMEIWGAEQTCRDNTTIGNYGSGLSLVAPGSSVTGHTATGNGHGVTAGIVLPRILNGSPWRPPGTYSEASDSFLSGCKTLGNGLVGLDKNAATPGIVLGANDFR